MGFPRSLGILVGVALILAGALIVVPAHLGAGAGTWVLVGGAAVVLVGFLVLGLALTRVPGRT